MEAAEYHRMARVEERHWWFRARLAVVRTFLKKYVPPGRGLDCSCGTGLTLKALPQWVQTGADLSDLALKHTRQRGLDQLMQADLRQLPVKDGALDLVTSLDTLEHIDDDEQALREIFRVVRPGGHVLLTVPAHPWMLSAHDKALHHVRRYRYGEFKAKIVAAGYSVISYRYMNTALFPLVAGVRLIHRRSEDSTSDTENVPPGPVNFGLYQIFALERLLLPVVPAPWGVSLICVAKKPSS